MEWSNFTTPNTTTSTTSQVPPHVTISYPVPVIVTSAVSCVLSIIGAIVIYGTYVALPGIRNFTRQLILCLTAADFLTCSGYLISVVRYAITSEDADSVSCLIQSIVTTYSSLVSFFLTVAIAYHMFVLVIFQCDPTNPTKTMVIYNLVSWVIPGIIIVIAASEGVLGPDQCRAAGTGPWCWVKSTIPRSTFWMILTGKGWELACYILTSSFYVLLKFHLCRLNRVGFSQIHHTLRDEDKNFLYVWYFLYLVRIWGTIRFFVFVSGVNTHRIKRLMKGLLYLQAAGDPSQAFVNAILFCVLDKSVRRALFCREPKRNIELNDGINTEKTVLLEDEIPAGPPHIYSNSDYGTAHSSMSSSTWSQSRSSELEHMADRA